MGRGASSDEAGGWQGHWKAPPSLYPRPLRVLSLASSERVRGLRREGDDDEREKFEEGSGQPWW